VIHSLDARNILCPLPVIRTQNKIKTLIPGNILEVTCTDPGVINDIPTWCRINHHHVLNITQNGNEIIIRIEVGEGG
jgi:tRNA 2-thiouridine synthesizing protein A